MAQNILDDRWHLFYRVMHRVDTALFSAAIRAKGASIGPVASSGQHGRAGHCRRPAGESRWP